MDKLDLHADMESRIFKNKKRSEFPKWLFFGTFAIGIVAGLTYLNKDKLAIVIDSPNGQIIHFLKPYIKPEPVTPIVEYVLPPRPVKPPKPVAVRPEDVTSPHLEQWEREWKEKEKAKSQKKQTVFNEDNYRPRGAININKAPRQVATYSKPTQQSRKFSQTHSIPWTWESYGSGFSKHNKYGKFTYVETERGIDTNSICGNYKYGSIDYRDCRKAAKKWFQDRCSSQFKQACLAGNMIP